MNNSHSDKKETGVNSFVYSHTAGEISSFFKKRDPFSNKGDYGRALLICGSKRMQGAAVLSAAGALRSGAGIVCTAFPDKAYPAIASKLTESLLLPLDSDEDGFFAQSCIDAALEEMKKADAVLIGCGMGITAGTKRLLKEVIKECRVPLVIDADGINILSKSINIIKSARCPVVLTPHPGEMARLTGFTVDEIQSDRINTARRFSDEYGVTVVLKGAGTVVCSPEDEKIYVNTTGNPGMAKGGSGDLLAGIITSFLSQGMSCKTASVCGTFLHGMAGDIASEKLSQTASLPSDCANFLSEAFKKL